MSKIRLAIITTKRTIVTLFLGLSLCASSASAAVFNFTKLEVPFPGNDQTLPGGINDRGQIVGAYHDISTGSHGFTDDQGVFSSFDFPFPGTFVETHGTGINNSGQIVGYIDAFPNRNCCERHGFVFEHGVFDFLDVPFSGVTATTAAGINDRGQIVGSYNDSNGLHGFVFESGGFTPLDAPFPGAHDTDASGINNRGQIVGSYNDSNGMHGFVFKQGAFTSLNGPGGITAIPIGINDRGQIVGTSGGRGFVFEQGVFRSLDVPFPDARPVSTIVVGINNKGQIVGFYADKRGVLQGFSATPLRH